MRARFAFALAIAAFVISVSLNFWYFRLSRHPGGSHASTNPDAVASEAPRPSRDADPAPSPAPTKVYAHNLMLRKGPNFRIYVRWLRGQMTRTHRNVNPSFDDPDSFFLDIKTGVLRANIGDIAHFLNASGMSNSPLKNIALSGNGDQIKLTGTLHKVVPLPIELAGTIAALADNRIQVHVTKLKVLKIPVKALLGSFNVTVSDLFHPEGIAGVQVAGNDIFFDTQTLLPPPHIRGRLTKVRVVNPDLEEVYGNAENDVSRVEQWRNFLRLRDGTLDFGKLTMRHVDLVMVDISKDAWFDLDLTHYQDQLVNGYTRMTPQAGLQIFMPDLDTLPHNKANQNISIEWMKNRNLPPPPDVTQ
jgi:hypothetical protein